MRLDRKAARIIFPRLGSNMPPPIPVEADFDRFRRMQEAYGFGGLVLFHGDLRTTPARLATLQQESDHPILVASDIERGAGQQLAGATLFPHARAFERLGADAETAVETFGAITASEARAAGIHIVFGPVADVNRDPRNPIIGTRAFGSDTEKAASLVRAYIRGCRRGGLLATAKHFPGHGNTHADSHAELPVVVDAEEVLVAHDLAPFRAAIAEGVELIMTAHVAYPALDASGTPATVSRPILHDLLRGRLGFQGAVVTDSLIMGAVRDRYATEAERAAALLQAGVDIILDPLDPPAAVRGVVEAVERGLVPEERLDDAIRRVEALWTARPAAGAPSGSADAHRAFSAEVARRALHSRRLTDEALRTGPDTLWIVLNPFARGTDRPAPYLASRLAEEAGSSWMEIGRDDDASVYETALLRARDAGAVVVAAIVKPAAWHAFGLPEPMHALATRIFASRPAVLAVLGSPQVMDTFPDAGVQVCSFSDVPASVDAIAEHILRVYLPR